MHHSPQPPLYALTLLLCYLCGAIPFGVVVGRLKGVDVRAVGSGNIGATNVFRALGPAAGLAVFALDFLKGVAAIWIGRAFFRSSDARGLALCAACVLVGHTFSVFLGFRGGKGIATGLGAVVGLAPVVALVSLAFWGVVLLFSRMISAASIVACCTVVGTSIATHQPLSYSAIFIIMAIVALVKHIPNMKRIAGGVEPKIGARKTADANRYDVAIVDDCPALGAGSIENANYTDATASESGNTVCASDGSSS